MYFNTKEEINKMSIYEREKYNIFCIREEDVYILTKRKRKRQG